MMKNIQELEVNERIIHISASNLPLKLKTRVYIPVTNHGSKKWVLTEKSLKN